MLRVGVLGAGHLGKIHIRILNELKEQYELVGFFDPNDSVAEAVAAELGIKRMASVEHLIDEVDVVDIVTPTLSHYECASKALKKRKHVFIEKPLTNTVEEARSLLSLASEAEVKVQVGHVERFNPAFMAALPEFDKPLFIESHRLAQFNPRGTDVSVVLDLMIHDLDIILSVVKSNIRRVSASGVAVLSDTPDIANARIEFDNGCVANLTASRISMKNMRKSRFFQKNAYISVDFLEKQTEIVTMTIPEGEPDPFDMVLDLGDKGKRIIQFNKPDVEPNNAIKEELSTFAESIQSNSTPKVTIEDGFSALSVAHEIMEKLNRSAHLIEDNSQR